MSEHVVTLGRKGSKVEDHWTVPPRFRAECECTWTGRWRGRRATAERDGAAHVASRARDEERWS